MKTKDIIFHIDGEKVDFEFSVDIFRVFILTTEKAFFITCLNDRTQLQRLNHAYFDRIYTKLVFWVNIWAR